MSVREIIDELPKSPPSHFERVTRNPLDDPWQGRTLSLGDYIGHGFSETWSSSSSQAVLWSLSWIRDASPTSTVSKPEMAEQLSDLIQADDRAASVREADATENVFDLRRMTGLTWERLAELLNVDRRTIHNWIKGGEIRKANRAHIASALAVLRFADRGSAEENVAALEGRSAAGLTPFEAIQSRRYSDAKVYLSPGLPRPLLKQPRPRKVLGTGQFQPILMHEGADGSEKMEALPNEPKPSSRTKPIVRG